MSGVSYWQSVDCDSCRVEIPLSQVDSLRTVHGERNAMLGIGLPVAFGLLVLVVWNLSAGD
ncbi:MAG: hypothetical protein ACREQV_15490 [Candidatus Binatia bacterium]